MRDLFPGYYRPTDQEFDEIWREAIFAFDANVLLNIYRYSEDTREAFLKILTSLKERIWLPHQAALEYQENRLIVLSAQFKAYDEIPKLLNRTLAELRTVYPRHPFIPIDRVIETFSKGLKDISTLLENAKTDHPDLVEADVLRDTLTDVFDGRVGQPFDHKRLVQIYEDGDIRFRKLIPPGYKDAKKDSEKKYGDLILWNQLKEFGKANRKSLVLVTDDRKDDWWQEHNGKTIGPRPELIQEMRADADLRFYMYQSDQFIEHAQGLLGLEPGRVLEEVREVREQESIQNQIQFGDSWERLLTTNYDELLKISFTPASSAMFYLSVPRTFSELRAFFGNNSKRARTFIEFLLAHELVTIDTSKNPHTFLLNDEGEQRFAEFDSQDKTTPSTS